ncbi:MAG: hypothetical protein KBF30_08950 [Hyphomonadaceae bacterium]|nr:hypothetical protein [Hyphomonadaceae bacterium]
MTPARSRASEIASPSLRQIWLAAMLGAFVELMHKVVPILRMKPLRSVRDWHTETAEASLPKEKTDILKETNAVPQDSPKALMLRSASKLCVSKHRRVRTGSRDKYGAGLRSAFPGEEVGEERRRSRELVQGDQFERRKP